ncbi:MAG: hypothetical protein KC777_01530 [Cyanobacteria bacterium HKST-UBA02]|nr:hypothetical protein [Cyanobacteria bacterium HKST-UBA02]
MQIRIANRQDEKKIRALAEAVAGAAGKEFDLQGADNDLINVEANYFGKQGLFLVADRDGEIIAAGGARAKSEDILEISRFLASEDEGERPEIEAEMLRVMIDFAPRMLYRGIECSAELGGDLLESRGFDPSGCLQVTPDF